MGALESLPLILVHFYEYASTVNPWTMQGLRTLTPGTVENRGITFDLSIIRELVPEPLADTKTHGFSSSL